MNAPGARKRTPLVLVPLLVVAGLGCHPAPYPFAVWSFSDSAAVTPSHAGLVTPDLSSLKLYRNTFAVRRVGHYEHHFTVWYRDPDWVVLELGVSQDPVTGGLNIERTGGSVHGYGAPPAQPPPVPLQLAELEHALERELRDRHPALSGWAFAYRGEYREVDLLELVVMPGRPPGSAPMGWHGAVTIAADEALVHVIGILPIGRWGLGTLEAKEPVQWVSYVLPAELVGSVLMTARLARPGPRDAPSGVLLERTLEAARRLQAGIPSPPQAEIAAAQGEALLPRELKQRLYLHVDAYAEPPEVVAPGDHRHVDMVIPFTSNDVVQGPVHGEAEALVGGEPIRMEVELVPRAPTELGSGERRFRGFLSLRIEDGQPRVRAAVPRPR